MEAVESAKAVTSEGLKMADITKIMIVDDEDDIRAIAELSLSNVAGWKVFPISSGHLAEETAIKNSPDIVLLDVMMPEIDGPTTFGLLKANPETNSIPIIFMTAKVQAKEIQQYIDLGAIGVIRKPFDPMILHEEIQRLVDK